MPKHRATLLLFGLAIFLGAALLFVVQLIFAKLVLPLFGGAPAVWNTAMVFYQATLLAGYGYAYLLSSKLDLRAQVIIHAVVLAAALLFLPLAIPAGWQPPAGTSPIPSLLGLLAMAVGVPFFAVSTTSPLLQRWFAATGHPDARDPYFLYTASNAGSLAGLLGYPLLIEPNSAVQWQAGASAAAFGVLTALSVGCGLLAWRQSPLGVGNPVLGPSADGASDSGQYLATWPRRFRWVACALVPSSLMLSVATYVSSDVAAVPLVWVLPLALYLASFVLVFARRPLVPQATAQRALPALLVPAVMATAARLTTPMPLLAGLHLVAFFVAALVCHGELARARPPARHLTEFYLWMSVGGALGGAFNALLAPIVFENVLEYHVMLAAAAYLGVPRPERADARSRWLDVLLPAVVALLAAGLILAAKVDEQEKQPLKLLVAFGLPALLCFFMSRRPVRFALGLGAVLLAAEYTPGRPVSTVEADRSFFGVHRVSIDAAGKFHQIMHGKTIHGKQARDPAQRRVPLMYYHPTGPLGQVFAAWEGRLNGPIGAVGLGAGASALYAKPGQEITFYEIDPVVKRIASDPRYFTHIADSPGSVSIVMGDARLSLGRAPDGHYRMLILDAYSSDSIPVHLVTREALKLYLKKLAPEGLIAFHISNLHVRLRPVVGNLARDAGLVCLFQEDADLSDDEAAQGKAQSQWAVMARSEADLAPIIDNGRWRRENGDPSARVWTDDYSSIVSVLDFSLK
ncbi:MAG: fused MFS/spermidine synthase [Deltaproteobacteria bacterium]|nr:fused MFS/spermidine synthase [Deltaproteobacteria bacterium]